MSRFQSAQSRVSSGPAGSWFTAVTWSRKVQLLDRWEAADDWQLVDLCKKDKSKYVQYLIRRHYELVVNLSFRFLLDSDLAREAAQDVFLVVFERVDKLENRGRPFVHWLCRVTANHCRTLAKRFRRAHSLVEEGTVDFWYDSSPFSAPDAVLEQKRKDIETMNKLLGLLPLHERMVLVLSEVAELNTAEIAGIQGAPPYTVRRRLQRAKERLRKLMVQHSLAGSL